MEQSDEEIATVAERYFQDLFTTTNPSNMERFLMQFTPELNHMLLQPYTTEEVRRAFFSNTSLKITWIGWYVSLFFPKILGYCWPRCERSCIISAPFKSLFKENEFYPYCFDSIKKKSTICLITA